MNYYEIFFLVVFSGLVIWLIGQSLIDSYFQRKGELVDKIQDNMKGRSDG